MAILLLCPITLFLPRFSNGKKDFVILEVFEIFNKTIILSHQVYFESDQIYKLMLLYQTLIPEKKKKQRKFARN